MAYNAGVTNNVSNVANVSPKIIVAAIPLQSRNKGGIADIQLIRRYAFHLQRLTAYCVLKMYVHFAQKMSRINANVVQ